MIDVAITITGLVGSGKSIVKDLIKTTLEARGLSVIKTNTEDRIEQLSVQGELKYGTTVKIIPNCMDNFHNFEIVQRTKYKYTVFCSKCGLTESREWPNAKA